MSVPVVRHVVVVLHDHVPADAPADVKDNLVQAREVAAALESLGFEVHGLAFGHDLAAVVNRLRSIAPECVFNLVESVDGDGKQIHVAAAVLESLSLRFTGAGTSGHVCTGDKRVAKRLLMAAGVPTPRFAESVEELDAWGETDIGIVKPAREDASVAIDAGSVVRGRRALKRELRSRQMRFGGEWFAEEFVDGREFNVSMLWNHAVIEVLPIAEIEFVGFPPGRPRIVDYEAKWQAGSFAYANTPRRFDVRRGDGELLSRLESVARRCHAMFALGGYSRIDFRIDGAGNVYVLEINANPCLSSDAGFMAAARQAGIAPSEVIARIVKASKPASPAPDVASDAPVPDNVLRPRFGRG